MKSRSPTTCPIVFPLDIFGDKWSLVVLRDVIFNGKSHFRELLASEEKIASNVLSSRLEMLVGEGLLVREDDPANKSAALYRPTEKALDLIPMLFALMRWGIKYNPNVNTDTASLQDLLYNPEGLHAKILARFTALRL